MNKNIIIKLFIALTAIVIIFSSLTRLLGGNTLTLTEYAKENPEALQTKETTPTVTDGDSVGETLDTTSGTQNSSGDAVTTDSSTTSSGAKNNTADHIPSDTAGSPNKTQLIGASLNGDSMRNERITYTKSPAYTPDTSNSGSSTNSGNELHDNTDSVSESESGTADTASFYYEPLSDHLRRYITGITYPQTEDSLEITYDDLRYLHITHYDFEGNVTEGELICNKSIAQDLMEIFHELYQNQYQIEKVRLMDEYEGDDTASMEDNNTSCFNYRPVDGTNSLSKHALGLAIDINPYYNPYVTYTKTNETRISPAGSEPYADRTANFPYKIDETDLCYKLFKEHGFTWGGNWNSLKDYQHFQKTN